MNQPKLLRPEFPRPDRERALWQSLNGAWEFEFEDGSGEDTAWTQDPAWKGSRTIQVPFAWQAPLSGVGELARHDRARYRRRFRLSAELQQAGTGKRVILHFGAVDYEADVWLDGRHLGRHVGGYTPFSFSLDGLSPHEEHLLDVAVCDLADPAQPRGKQYWKDTPDRCWYTPSSGIWQSVWLEAVGPVAIENFFVTSHLAQKTVTVEVELDREASGLVLRAQVSREGQIILASQMTLNGRRCRILLPIAETDFVDEIHHWTPDNPFLFDLELTLLHGDSEWDRISTYFAMRSIRTVEGKIYLNERPLYQRLVLDQGYWSDGLLTAPSDQAIIDDIEWAKKLGFNGVRKHQKIEDPRFYYWADRLGLLVWAELPSAYEFCRTAVENSTRDWLAFLARDYNHPCIVVWVPFNESWGVRNVVSDPAQQELVLSLVRLTKAWDQTRLVSGNDGWEGVESDLVGLHDYSASASDIAAKLENLPEVLRGSFGGNRRALADGHAWSGQPVLVTEFGGIAFEGSAGWGYFDAVADEAAFLVRFEEIVRVLDRSGRLAGWCYTQLTDVFQESNGLLTMGRRPKIDPNRIRSLVRGETPPR